MDEQNTGVDEDVDTDDVIDVDERKTGVDDDVDVDDVIDDDNDVAGDTRLADAMDTKYGQRTGAHNLRPRKQPSFAHLHTVAHTAEDTPSEPTATTQMSMKRGIQQFGEAGLAAVSKEIQQLHDRQVMEAKHPKALTPEQRKEALAYLMFLKRKRCGTIKGRGCADGRKQRAYTDKDEATSPTIATEAVFLTAVIDALEGRDVAVVDVPGAFMQTDMDELVHVRFTGTMVDMLLDIDYEMYSPFITYEGKNKVLYVELLKALYGTLRAARLFWEKLTGKLIEWGFTMNPYDSCVGNKIVNGKQCTVGWHIDDLKISHVDSKVVDCIIDLMDAEFGKEAPLTKSRGKVHEYLGMTFDYSIDGMVTVEMSNYIQSVIAEMPDEMTGKAATPANVHLFDVREEPTMLDKEQSDTFHRMVMQLQYLSQRARPDLRTAVSFLCKRVTKPGEDDWKKLTRAMISTGHSLSHIEACGRCVGCDSLVYRCLACGSS
jgi:hypothetical protein